MRYSIYLCLCLMLNMFSFTASAQQSGYGDVQFCQMKSWMKFLNPGPQSVKKAEKYNLGNKVIQSYKFDKIKGGTAKLFLFAEVADGCFVRVVSLGSYEATTQISREMGDIKKTQRLYHMDLYAPNSHSTLGFFKKPLSYEAAKDIANKSLK